MRRITVTVDPDDYAAFDRLAQQGRVTASWLIRQSMREFIERHEREGGTALQIGEVPRGKQGGGANG